MQRCGIVLALALPACAVSPASTSPRLPPHETALPPRVASAIAAELPAQDPTEPAQQQPQLDQGEEAQDQELADQAEPIDDGLETDPDERPAAKALERHPLADWSSQDIEHAIAHDPGKLGCMSLGRTNAGALMNAVQMPEGPYWKRVDPARCWGTTETIEYLTRAITKVNQQFPDTQPMYIGHISRKHGGHLSPHVSHQTGRDVDVSYYLLGDSPWYARANARNLDPARTWAFVRALITETDVELILIDSSIQRLLRDYALSIGEDPDWIDSVIQYGSRSPRPLVRHARGHATHIHVRFFNPIAQETARRAYPHLVKLGKIQPPTHYVQHKAKRGDTLGSLANRYGTTVRAIQESNQLRSTKIRAGVVYRIPKAGGVPLSVQPVVVPARRLPPYDPGKPPKKAASEQW